MPSDSQNSKRPGSREEKDLVETLGNPGASESEWLHASQNLGEYKPKASLKEKQARRTKVLASVAVVLAIGLGTFGVSNLTQHAAPVEDITPTPPPVAASADVDFGPYMANLQRAIKRNWFPPKGLETRQVVVIFAVAKSGALSKLRIDRSSGLAKADQAALKAVENAAPFKPLPEGASENVDIQFTFDYNVFSGGHSAHHGRSIAVDESLTDTTVARDEFRAGN